MRYTVISASLLFLITACTADHNAIEAECGAHVGEACNKLGKTAETPARSAHYFKLACEYENTNGCNNYAAAIQKDNPTEAKQALKISCDRGNTTGCAELAKLIQSQIKN